MITNKLLNKLLIVAPVLNTDKIKAKKKIIKPLSNKKSVSIPS